MNKFLRLVLLAVLCLVLLGAICNPDDDDDNDDASPADDDSVDDDAADDDAIDDDAMDDDQIDDDFIDDDIADDDAVDDDTIDDDAIDDDVVDDDAVDDDAVDDDVVDDDAVDDDATDDDIVVLGEEYVFGGSPYPFDMTATDEGPIYFSVKAGGWTFLFTLDEQKITSEELPMTLKPVDIQIDPAGNLHMLAKEEGITELKHLWRIDNAWYEETIPDSNPNNISEMVLDDNGKIHLCQGGSQLRYFTNASGEWINTLLREFWMEGANHCHIQVGIDGSVYLTYKETWYDGQGHPFENNYFMTNAGGDWESLLLTDHGDIFGSYLAVDDVGRVDLVFLDDSETRYGYWDGMDWTFETVAFELYDLMGIWRFGNTPTILLKTDSDYELFEATRSASGWTVSPLGVTTGYINELAPTTTGQWRIAYRDSEHDGLFYLNNLTGNWNDEAVYYEPEVFWPISTGIDLEGNRFFLAKTNQGLFTATQIGDGWQVEPLDIGVSPFSNAVATTDAQGVTHLVGYSSPNVVYANNREGFWQSETIGVGNTDNYRIAARPDGEPVITYFHSNDIYCATHEESGWTIEQLTENLWIDSWSIAFGANADGDVFVCYDSISNNNIYCARRQAGQWTTDVLDDTSYLAESTQALAIDMNGDPHYIFKACNYKYQCAIRQAVFHDNQWEITSIGTAFFDEAGLAIDEQGNSHLAITHYSNDNTLSYGTDSSGDWQFQIVTSNLDSHNMSIPTLLTDGTVQIPFRRGSALWRAVLAPSNP